MGMASSVPADFWRPDVVVERFWSRVDKNGPLPAHNPSLGRCWLWSRNRSKKGYGYFQIPDPDGIGNARPIGAHCFAWSLANGPIPDGLWVLHQCDNPPCCNPRHLEVGDQSRNMREAWDRGRIANVRYCRGDDHYTRKNPGCKAGERNGRAKLTDVQVAQIRALYDPSKRGSKAALARQFGVSSTHVGLIVKGAFRKVA